MDTCQSLGYRDLLKPHFKNGFSQTKELIHKEHYILDPSLLQDSLIFKKGNLCSWHILRKDDEGSPKNSKVNAFQWCSLPFRVACFRTSVYPTKNSLPIFKKEIEKELLRSTFNSDVLLLGKL